MRTLVTGGAGFIGSHVVDALLDRGDAVCVLDDLSTGRRANVAATAELVEGSILDPAALERALAGVEVVFHLAAQIDVRRSVEDPAYDLAVNVGGTIAVARAAAAAGARHLVFASTGGAIYGDCETVPTPESAPERPLAPYGQAKLSAEGYLRLLADLGGAAATAVRFANVYGPRQDPLGEGGVCAIFCGAAVTGRPVTVFGDGEQTRDFVYVGDVVQAMLRGVDAPFGPFNIGTGEETTVNALAAQLALDPAHAEERPGEVRRSCLDPTAAGEGLGWRAEMSLPDGLELTMHWARSVA